MNAWAAVFLVALLFHRTLDVLTVVLNVGALGQELPPEFRGVYDAWRYRRAQEYARARARFELVPGSVRLAVLLAFWWAGGFGWLDRAVRALGFGPIPTGLAFVGALALGGTLLGLPFRWWSTFVVESRFGFNRTTPRTFWTDLAKGLALSALLGGPLLAAVLWLFQAAGTHAWLWCWLVTTAYLIAVQYVAPTWILPLFNRFTPLGDGELREAILAYARGVGFPLAGVFVVDGSRRSTKGNAFFTGFGRRKRIALYDTLLERLNTGEVLGVVAHEIGHYKRHHVVQALAIAILHAGAVFFFLSLVLERPALYAAFHVDRPSVHVGLVLFGLLLGPFELPLEVALQALSRRHEREADAFAAETTGSGERLASALARLSADALANLTPHWLHVVLNHSHPPVRERVRTLSGRAS
jgi:STE24 endopeptidase